MKQIIVYRLQKSVYNKRANKEPLFFISPPLTLAKNQQKLDLNQLFFQELAFRFHVCVYWFVFFIWRCIKVIVKVEITPSAWNIMMMMMMIKVSQYNFYWKKNLWKFFQKLSNLFCFFLIVVSVIKYIWYNGAFIFLLQNLIYYFHFHYFFFF